jgi:surfactin synthase thioesterase subunit
VTVYHHPVAGRWVAPSGNGATSLVRFVCLGGIGAGTAAFAPWRTGLPPWIDIAPIRLPGRESRVREPAMVDLAELLDALVPVVRSLAAVPYLLIGHCFGATVLFEVARRLMDEAPRSWPEGLVVLNQSAPPLTRTVPAADPRDVWERFAHLVDIDERVLRNPALRDMVEPMVRADFALADSYVYSPSPPLPIGITVWLGREDGLVTRHEAMAWAARTAGTFSFRAHSGAHEVPTDANFLDDLGDLAAEIVERRWGFRPS